MSVCRGRLGAVLLLCLESSAAALEAGSSLPALKRSAASPPSSTSASSSPMSMSPALDELSVSHHALGRPLRVVSSGWWQGCRKAPRSVDASVKKGARQSSPGLAGHRGRAPCEEEYKGQDSAMRTRQVEKAQLTWIGRHSPGAGRVHRDASALRRSPSTLSRTADTSGSSGEDGCRAPDAAAKKEPAPHMGKSGGVSDAAKGSRGALQGGKVIYCGLDGGPGSEIIGEFGHCILAVTLSREGTELPP